MNRCWSFVCAAIVVIVIVILVKYQKTKSRFVEGMWSNSKNDLYMYIDNKVDDDRWRGGYIVSEKLNVNEPFKLKAKIGVSDNVEIRTMKSNFLKKKMVSKLKLDDGAIEITSKDNKKYKLYKDSETSDDMKKLGTKDSSSPPKASDTTLRSRK